MIEVEALSGAPLGFFDTTPTLRPASGATSGVSRDIYVSTCELPA
jgi:hypothetical protein